MREIENIGSHIGVLERRRTYLDERVSDGRRSSKARGFEKRERDAIEAGIRALKVVEHITRPSTSPALALSELIDALEEGVASMMPPKVAVRIARAQAVLEMLADA